MMDMFYHCDFEQIEPSDAFLLFICQITSSLKVSTGYASL